MKLFFFLQNSDNSQSQHGNSTSAGGQQIPTLTATSSLTVKVRSNRRNVSKPTTSKKIYETSFLSLSIFFSLLLLLLSQQLRQSYIHRHQALSIENIKKQIKMLLRILPAAINLTLLRLKNTLIQKLIKIFLRY